MYWFFMRPLAPTSRSHGRGPGALHPVLAASGAVLGLVLAALALGLWVPGSLAQHGRSQDVEARAVQASAPFLKAPSARPDVEALTTAPGEWAAVLGVSPAFQSHAPLFSARGRTGFAPPPQAVHTAVRARQDALVSALVRVMRYSAAPVSAGFTADRPTIVTRPLRGPPSLA